MRKTLTIALALGLASCATVEQGQAAEEQYVEREAGDENRCDAASVQSLVGEIATAEIGERILRESGAARLRWGPPDSAWTMDYRIDRVNVRYDRGMVIEAITCG